MKTLHEMVTRIEGALAPVMAPLGLRGDVLVDGRRDVFLIRTWLPRIWRRWYLDYEVLVGNSKDAIAALVQRELEAVQGLLFDDIRSDLDRLDVRKRIVSLSDEDKETLYEMLNDACSQALKDGGGREPNERIMRYHALVDRLFR